jgi:hypothetical protein
MKEGASMFDSLDEQIKKTEDRTSTGKERTMRWVFVAVAAVVVCGGLILGVQFLR